MMGRVTMTKKDRLGEQHAYCCHQGMSELDHNIKIMGEKFILVRHRSCFFRVPQKHPVPLCVSVSFYLCCDWCQIDKGIF